MRVCSEFALVYTFPCGNAPPLVSSTAPLASTVPPSKPDWDRAMAFLRVGGEVCKGETGERGRERGRGESEKEREREREREERRREFSGIKTSRFLKQESSLRVLMYRRFTVL